MDHRSSLLLAVIAAVLLSACGPQPSVPTPVTDASGNVVGTVQQQQGPSFGEQVAAAGIGSVVGNMISGGLRGGGHTTAAPVQHTTVVHQTVVRQNVTKNVTINRPRPSFSPAHHSFSHRR